MNTPVNSRTGYYPSIRLVVISDFSTFVGRTNVGQNVESFKQALNYAHAFVRKTKGKFP